MCLYAAVCVPVIVLTMSSKNQVVTIKSGVIAVLALTNFIK